MVFNVWLAQLICKIPAGVEEFWDCKGVDFPPSLQFPLAREPLRPAEVMWWWVTAVCQIIHGHSDNTRARDRQCHIQTQSHASFLLEARVVDTCARWEQREELFMHPILTGQSFNFICFPFPESFHSKPNTDLGFMYPPGWRNHSPQAGCLTLLSPPAEPQLPWLLCSWPIFS